MALYSGEKIIAPSNDSKATTLQKALHKQFEEVKQMFEHFKVPGVEPTTILLTRDFEKKWNRRKTSWKPAPPINFPLVANFYDETVGSVQLRYASSPPQRVDGGRLVWNREKDIDMFFENMAITSDRLDLAWFFLKGTNYLKNGMYRIVDNKADFSAKFDEFLLEKSATNLIYDESVTEEQIAKVATLFFKDGQLDFASVSGKHEMVIKLHQTASVNQKNKQKPGFAELKEMCDMVGLGKKEEPAPDPPTEMVVMFKGTTNEVEIPLEIKPDEITREALYEEAEKYGLKPGAVKNDVLFTMVKYCRENVNNTQQSS